MEPDKKLEELILYLATHSQDDRSFGATKLNKLLFFCDFLAFRAWGESITGHPYQKLRFGPAPRAILPVLERMEESGRCARVPRTYFGRTQTVVVPLAEPAVDVFETHELELIADVLKEYRYTNGKEISDLSHQFIGWQAADMGGEIPYATVYVGSPDDFSAEEVEACLAAAMA